MEGGQGTLKQVTDPTNAHVGPCDELATHLGCTLPLPIVYHPPKGIKHLRRPIN